MVHLKYRTIGLGTKLVRETLPLVGKPYVEMIAVMAKYNPFAERAGMKKIYRKRLWSSHKAYMPKEKLTTTLIKRRSKSWLKCSASSAS